MDERVEISTPDHVSLEFELAGAGSRFAAYLIDLIFNLVLMLAVVLVAFLTGGWIALRGCTAGAGAVTSSWLWEGLGKGSTPGKKKLGIRVVRQNGLPIGLREAALRNLVRVADMLPPPSYILGGLVMHFDRYGRRLGDMLAGTYVVVEKFDLATQGASGAAWAKRVEQGGSRQALTLPRGTISAQQLVLIEQFLARAHGLARERRDQLTWQIAEPLLPLLNEDRDSLARSAERTERCHRLLLQVLELSKEKKPAGGIAATKSAPPPSLF
jgi:uncharacterized RDD family membrane protein YckC